MVHIGNKTTFMLICMYKVDCIQVQSMPISTITVLRRCQVITEQVVQAMIDKIINMFSPDKIIVFGSWARKEFNEHSDVDFLVIMPYGGSKRDTQVAIRRALKGFGVPKDVIVATGQEIEQKKSLSGYIYGAALREGRVVYERVRQ